MADEVKNGLSADPSRIASQWNRSTVADGSWLQKYTLSPLTARDYYLASAIDALGSATDDTTSALSAAISSVSSIHDEYIHYLSATISGDISGYIDYVSGQVDSLSSEFKTSANAISSKLDNEIQRATEVEEVLKNQINLINASTDVINVYGSYGGENGFSVESAYYFDQAKTATYHLTNNDIIKIINDEYTPVEETGQTTTGHQTYYQWINNEGITGDPQSPSDGSWNFIGYTEPYYNIAEVNNKFTDISATVADNYLSANNTAVSAGKNIIVTNETGPKVGIKTKEDVEFTNVSSTNISATTLTALTATGTSAKFTNVSSQNLSSTNISATNLSATNASGTSAIYNNLSSNKLYALTASGNSAKFDNISSTTVTALTATGNSAKFTNISATNISADLFKSDLGEVNTYNLKFISANGGSLTANDATINLLTSTTLYGQSYNSNVDSLIGSAQSGKFAWNVINSAKFSAVGTTTSTAYLSGGFGIEAGQGVGVSLNGKNVVITAEGTTYSAGSYISTANKTISVTGNLIGSAESGQSAYDWITTKSATLQAGPGIGLYSAGPNILGISAEGTKVSAGGNIQNPTEYTTNVNLSAGGGVQFVTANNDVLGIKTSTMVYSPYNSTYSDITSFKISAVASQGTLYESVVRVNDSVYGVLMPNPGSFDHLKIPVARYVDGRGYYYLDTVNGAIGNYVSAAKQQRITVATAASLPQTLEENVYYLI